MNDTADPSFRSGVGNKGKKPVHAEKFPTVGRCCVLNAVGP
jgi:hypothetical protein